MSAKRDGDEKKSNPLAKKLFASLGDKAKQAPKQDAAPQGGKAPAGGKPAGGGAPGSGQGKAVGSGGMLDALVSTLKQASPGFGQEEKRPKKPDGYEHLKAARGGKGIGPGAMAAQSKAVQSALLALGVSIEETGVYDEATEDAVRAFQREKGLEKRTGRFDAETLDALDKALGLVKGGRVNITSAGPVEGSEEDMAAAEAGDDDSEDDQGGVRDPARPAPGEGRSPSSGGKLNASLEGTRRPGGASPPDRHGDPARPAPGEGRSPSSGGKLNASLEGVRRLGGASPPDRHEDPASAALFGGMADGSPGIGMNIGAFVGAGHFKKKGGPVTSYTAPSEEDRADEAASSGKRKDGRPQSFPRAENAFIDRIAWTAVRAMWETGVPASALIAMAVLEGSWGDRPLARDGKNLFGLEGEGPAGSLPLTVGEAGYSGSMEEAGAVQGGGRGKGARLRWRKYSSWDDSIFDMARHMATEVRYAPAIAAKGATERLLRALSDVHVRIPHFGETCVRVYEQHGLGEYDRVRA